MKTGGVYLGFHTLRGRKFPYGNFRTSVFCEVKTQIVGKTIVFRQWTLPAARGKTEFFRQDGEHGEQRRREQIARHAPAALRRNEQVVDGVKTRARAKDARRAGHGQPAAAEYLRHAEAGQHAAQDVQRPRRDAPDQQKTEVRRPVLGQIADVFKGGEACGERDGRRRQLLRRRLEDQIKEQQRQQLHPFLAHGRDLDGRRRAVRTVIPHEKTADIGAEQADRHADDQKQRVSARAPPDEEQGQDQRQRQTEIDVFDIGHLSPTSRSVSGSSAAMDSVSVRSTA